MGALRQGRGGRLVLAWQIQLKALVKVGWAADAEGFEVRGGYVSFALRSTFDNDFDAGPPLR